MNPITPHHVIGPIQLPVLLPGDIFSNFKLYFFRLPKGDYYAVEKGNVREGVWIPVRVHSACNLAHIFHSQRCDCQPQLELALTLMHYAGQGLLIYALGHEGRGVGPLNHVRVYAKQDEGYDTVDSFTELGLPVDQREYSEVIEIIKWFDIKKLRLLTNNPKKIAALQNNFEVIREPLIAKLHAYNQSQIHAKVEKLGHLIPLTGSSHGEDSHRKSSE